MPHVYVLLSSKTGKKYVGCTSLDPIIRLKEHNAGRVSWTNGHRPLDLIYSENFADELLAHKRERFFKTGKGRKVLDSLLKDEKM